MLLFIFSVVNTFGLLLSGEATIMKATTRTAATAVLRRAFILMLTLFCPVSPSVSMLMMRAFFAACPAIGVRL